MKNIIQCIGKTFTGVFFLSARYIEGHFGVLNIYQCEELMFGPKEGSQVEFTAIGGKQFSAAEEPNYMEPHLRETEPSKRVSPYTYIPYGWDRLNVFPTLGGGRFLMVRCTGINHQTLSSVNNAYTYDGLAVVCEDKNELRQQLVVALPMMGVPEEDVTKLKIKIINMF